jgi:Tol biopolymer transport system component
VPATPTLTPTVKPTFQAVSVGRPASCTDWFVYHTNQAGKFDIFRYGKLDSDPAASADLSQGQGKSDNIGPTLSRDNNFVAFSSNRDTTGNEIWEIYIASVDGKSVRRLTYDGAKNLSPAWSPNGKYIVYESVHDDIWDLQMINIENGVETRLTDNPPHNINAIWAPDSSGLLFQSDRDGKYQIYFLDITNLQVKKLSDGKGDDRDPRYSPDGHKISFRSIRENAATSAIYIMNSDGTNVEKVTDEAPEVTNQSWSPDSTLLAYQSNKRGNSDIYVYQLSTKKTRQITNEKVNHYAPSWRCDSPVLVFTSDVSGSPNLYSVPALPITAPPVNVKDTAQQLTNGQGDQKNEYSTYQFSIKENGSRILIPVVSTK